MMCGIKRIFLLICFGAFFRGVPCQEMSSDKYACAWARQCCQHTFNSYDFINCCNRDNCCPLSCGIFNGCAYNDYNYDAGTIVDSFPEHCIELMCTARMNYRGTAIVPDIVPVPHPGEQCKNSAAWAEKCVDDLKRVHEEGSVWLQDECTKCECKAGQVTCDKIDVVCPSSPHMDCAMVQGKCCPTWDCSRVTGGCMLGDVFIPERESVESPTSPCNQCSCIDGQLLCTEQYCIGCVSGDSFYYIGQMWIDPLDPCNTKFCIRDREILSTRVYCPGCVYRGKFYNLGDRWTDAAFQCYTFECHEDSLISMIPGDCPENAIPASGNNTAEANQ